MEILPLEIQDEIWKIYYKHLYSINMQKIKTFFHQINNFDENIEDIKKILRVIRFANDEKNKNTGKENLKKILWLYNEKIIEIIKSQPQKMISKKNDIFCYLIELIKFQSYYSDIPEEYKLISAYFNKYCNFQDNMMNRLKNSII